MFECGECGAQFEEMAEIHKPGGCYEADYGVYGDFDSHTYYPAVDYMGCPNCGAGEDDIIELELCDRCDAWAGEVYETAFGDLCENCYDDMFE